MLTASAMQSFQSELEKAVVLTLFIPLIMNSGGNSGSQATSLIIRALALRELGLRDWWRIALVASLIAGARFVPLESRNSILQETEAAWEPLVEAID
jgi:Mg/Co/Ni transporter MgtE